MTIATPDDMPENDPLRRLRALQTPKRAALSSRVTSTLRAYMPLDRDTALDEELDELIDGCLMACDPSESGGSHGRLAEGRILCLIGGSGTGKTRTIRRAFEKRKEFLGYEDRHSSSLLVSLVAPSPGISKQLAKTTLFQTGYESQRDLRENVAWEMVRRQLRLRGVRFLHIDELQHVLQNPNEREIQKVWDTLKGLLQQSDWPVWLILSGTPEIAGFLQADSQLRRRCRFVRFDPLEFHRDAKVVVGLIMAFCKRAELEPSGLVRNRDGTSDEFVGRLIHASLREVGTAIEFIQDAAKVAMRNESAVLAPEHFATAYRQRTGCPVGANVFSVEHGWELIDVRNALYPEEADDEDGDLVVQTREKKGGNK